MPKPMGSEDWVARAEAYQEAADHLEQSWTDDVREREQGNIISAVFRREAAKCQRIAANSQSIAMGTAT